MDKQVDDYIEKQKSPQKEILQKIRKIFINTISKYISLSLCSELNILPAKKEPSLYLRLSIICFLLFLITRFPQILV